MERTDCVYPATKNTEVELENTSLKMLKETSERVSSVSEEEEVKFLTVPMPKTDERRILEKD